MVWLLALLGCTSGADSSTPIEPPAEGVLIILADTLRADHTSLYDYERDTTPNLNAFAQDALVFDDFITQSGHTVASVSSLFTGLHRAAHNCCIEGVTLERSLPSMARRFGAAGYQTAGFHKSDRLLEIEPGGAFEKFAKPSGATKTLNGAESLTNRALSWLNNARDERPFFLYLHYTDPHDPYVAPDDWYGMFEEDYDSELTGHENLGEIEANDPSEDDLKRLRALYDAEIHYMDSQIQRLLEYLEDGGFLDETIVVFLGDHGEQFWEHGALGHTALYREQLHSPLMIYAPDVPAGRVSAPVQTIDLAPTLAGLKGVSMSDYWQGADLSEALRTGGEIPARDILSEFNGARYALHTPEGMKYIDDKGTSLLYDRTVDITEQENLALSRRDEVEELTARAQAIIEASWEIAEHYGVEIR